MQDRTAIPLYIPKQQALAFNVEQEFGEIVATQNTLFLITVVHVPD